MARNYETAVAELASARQELAAVKVVTDENACNIYNVDCKSEIIRMISEDIEYLKKEVEYLTNEVYEPEFNY